MPISGLMVLTAAPASAVLPNVGATDPDTGFPTWYADDTGLSLQLCLDGLPNCLASRADLLDAGAGGEAFWYAADAELGPMTVANHLEAAYLDVDQPIAFMRTQASAPKGGLAPEATYTIQDPYGTYTCTSDINGTIRNNACRIETGGTVPFDFTAAQAGRIGPFLTWDTYGTAGPDAPPAGYIGDSATPHRVIGSDFNMVRVIGPGINADRTLSCDPAAFSGPVENCAETDLFLIQGKVQPSASASLTPRSVDFGNSATTETRSITYTSTGAENVVVSNVAVSGSTDFSTTEDCTAATTGIAPGSSCTIDVTYTPRPGTTASGTVTVTDSVGTRTVSLAGRSQGVVTTDASSMAFGDVKVGTVSAPDVVTVLNDGPAPLTVTGTSLSGTGASHYQRATDCAVLDPGASCEVSVTFRPLSTGTKNATLTIATNGGNSSLSLTGRGTAPAVNLSPTSLAFGDQATGTTSASRSVLLTNSGTAPLFIDGVSTTDAATFPVTGGSCFAGLNLAPGSSCNVTLAFRPGSGGAKSGSLRIGGDGNTFSVALSGNGVAPPATVPNAPTGVSATGGNAQATVSWTAPADGGSPLTEYRVDVRTGTTVVRTVTGVTGTSTTIGTLTNGTAYNFQVRAVNAVGAGPLSASSNTVTPTAPAATPAAPTGVTATPGNTQATVRWTAGATGGSAITSWQVEVRTGTTVVRTITGIAAAARSTTVTGLTNGTAYNFRVRAVNAVGAGTFSAASNTVTPATTPGAPVIGTAVAGVAGGAITATANWTPPASNGGSPVTGYVVRALRIVNGAVASTTTSAVQPATARSLQMTLPQTGNYRFTAQAVNAIGSGPQSARSNLVAGR